MGRAEMRRARKDEKKYKTVTYITLFLVPANTIGLIIASKK